MSLHLYNTLSRRKEEFRPLDPQAVRFYVCGPTVYDFAHIGNARPVIVFDVLYRLLRQIYGADHVRYVRNITDVDDKINAAARANHEDIRTLTERTTAAFHEDVAALNALPPDVEPRATEHIPQMVTMIERLIAGGHAYAAEGHVLFAVASMAEYGRLSGRSRDEMIAGARVEIAPYKRDPADFVLWKPSPGDLPGWDSPWGRGRPGWHLECSAMSEAYLGETFDIHGGGLDLIFPHHENEIAQSVCAHHGHPFVNYWLHNGFVTVDGEKMAKSAGNFRTIRDVLRDLGWPNKPAKGEVARIAMLLTHYRDPLDWTSERLVEAERKYAYLYGALQAVEEIPAVPCDLAGGPFMEALLDDLNTPLALRRMDEIAKGIYKAASSEEKAQLKSMLLRSGEALGILSHSLDDVFHTVISVSGSMPREITSAADSPIVGFAELTESGDSMRASGTVHPIALSNNEIEEQIYKRTEARKAKDFALADKIRTELAIKGIVLEDGPGTTTWRRAD